MNLVRDMRQTLTVYCAALIKPDTSQNVRRTPTFSYNRAAEQGALLKDAVLS